MRFRLVFYKEETGFVPVFEWMQTLPDDALDKITGRLKLLASEGNRLRRPYADYIGNGIYELRARTGNVQYRILYFFHGTEVIVLSSGFTKERRIPKTELNRAKTRKDNFELNPQKHIAGETI